MLDENTIDDFAISLNDFIKQYEDKNFDVESFVENKIDMKEQITLILLSSGTTGEFFKYYLTHYFED